MLKRDIENATISGIGVDGPDVARLSRNGRVMTLRHSWNGADGRVIDGVTRAWRAWAERQMQRTGQSVEVYTRGGHCLAQVEPS